MKQDKNGITDEIVELRVLVPRAWLVDLDQAVAQVGGAINPDDRAKYPELQGLDAVNAARSA